MGGGKMRMKIYRERAELPIAPCMPAGLLGGEKLSGFWGKRNAEVEFCYKLGVEVGG